MVQPGSTVLGVGVTVGVGGGVGVLVAGGVFGVSMPPRKTKPSPASFSTPTSEESAPTTTSSTPAPFTSPAATELPKPAPASRSGSWNVKSALTSKGALPKKMKAAPKTTDGVGGTERLAPTPTRKSFLP